MNKDDLSPKIGLEIHLQLKTERKMFCGCQVVGSNAEPNTAICPICTGQPGSLPSPNPEAIKQGIRLALALDGEISQVTKFDRKNYFYPDLPKGYQISQYDQPLAQGGVLNFLYLGKDSDLREAKIVLERVHLEEDTGKLMHNGDAKVDLNRAGNPLCEIVTRPVIKSPLQARRFVQELQDLVRSLELSEADMEEGQLRIDANISLMGKGVAEYKVEVKNLNSFNALERALEFEFERQASVIEEGNVPDQETRGWDAEKQETVTQRGKEVSSDYRYFTEPDIPPFEISRSLIHEIEENLGLTPAQVRRELIEEWGLAPKKVFQLNSDILLRTLDLIQVNSDYKELLINMSLRRSEVMELSDADISQLLEVIDQNSISWNDFDEITLNDLQEAENIEEFLKEKGVVRESGAKVEEQIEEIAQQVIDEHPEKVKQYKEGKEGLIGFFVGKVLQSNKGDFPPQLVKEILKEKLTK